jgi:hypothetical protein
MMLDSNVPQAVKGTDPKGLGVLHHAVAPAQRRKARLLALGIHHKSNPLIHETDRRPRLALPDDFPRINPAAKLHTHVKRRTPLHIRTVL